jgi:hypothetical protein
MVLQDITASKALIAKLRQHLETAADPQQLKAWLKTLTLRQTYRPSFGMPF